MRTPFFDELVAGYLDATEGRHSPDRIECSAKTRRKIIKRIYDPCMAGFGPNASASQLRRWWKIVFRAKEQLFFMGAEVVRARVANNEVRFINSAKPDRNRVLVCQ